MNPKRSHRQHLIRSGEGRKNILLRTNIVLLSALVMMIFLVPAISLGSLANPLFGGDPFILDQMPPAIMLPLLFVSFFLMAGVGQELGWTGYLLPRLQTRFSALTTCIIRAVYGGIWHLPLLYYASQGHPAMADFPYGGWIAGKGFPVAFAVMIVMFLLPWSIFFTLSSASRRHLSLQGEPKL